MFVELTESEAFVVYSALIAAKDRAVLGLESRSEAQRSLSEARLVAVETAMRKVVAASYATVVPAPKGR